MKIAILGWGSLIKEPRGLPIEGEWQPDGPKRNYSGPMGHDWKEKG